MKKRGLSSIRPVPWCLREFLRLPGDTVEIVKSKNQPYGAWVMSSRGSVCAHTFTWILSIVHLLACEYCRKSLNLDLKEVKREFRRLLKQIEEESRLARTPSFLR